MRQSAAAPPPARALRSDRRGTGLLLGVGLAAVLAGCASTKAIAPEAPPAFAAAPDAAAAAVSGQGWAETLNAPGLTATVAEALAASPDLQAARARADAARARARGVAGRILPNLDLGFTGDRTETPTGVGDDRAALETVASRITASWEADIWGRALDRTRAALADRRAAESDYEFAALSTAGQTGRAWVDLVEARQLQALALEDLTTRERALALTERRYSAGVLNSLALRTARSQTAAARANLAAAEEFALARARRLQALLGRYPDGVAGADDRLPELTPLPVSTAPADLLARRPDVAAAEARVASAGLEVSAARKALLPRLTLTAQAFASGDGLAPVTDVDGLITQLAAGLTAPLFQGGQLQAEASAAAADRRAAAAAYVRAALDAWREVEDALSSDASLQVRERELEAAADEAREAQALAEREYERGVATIFELIDAYSRRIDAERGLISARAERVSNRINYHVAVADAPFPPSADDEADAPQQDDADAG